MTKRFNVFFKAILAGVYIALAAGLYLYVINVYNNKILASFLFSIGLLVVVGRNYYLYTGKVGYMLPYKKGNIDMITETLLGNFVGIVITSLIFNFSNITEINSSASMIVTTKFSNAWYVTLFLSYLCGVIMYTAVDGYNNIKDSVTKNLIVVLPVMLFLILGFEHSIANLAYIVLNKTITLKQVLYLILMIIGNGLGAISINLLHALINKE